MWLDRTNQAARLTAITPCVGRLARARVRFAALIPLLCCTAGLAAAPASTADRDVCNSSSIAPNQVVNACTRLMQSGRYFGTDLAAVMQKRADGYRRRGDFESAISDETAAIGLDPDDAQAFNRRGMLHTNLGQFDQAVADFTEALRLDPRNATVLNNRGSAWSGKGDLDKAFADYADAIRLDPHDGSAFYNRGLLERKTGNDERAVADFTEAIRLHLARAQAFLNRGEAYEAQGDLDRALADFTTYRTLVPEDPSASEAITRVSTKKTSRLSQSGRCRRAMSRRCGAGLRQCRPPDCVHIHASVVCRSGAVCRFAGSDAFIGRG